MKAITLLFFTIILNACGSAKPTTDLKNNNMTQHILDGKYIVNSINSKTKISKVLTLVFNHEAKKVSGFSGCNSFFGIYTQDGDSITFSDLASTKKYCPEAENEVENLMMKALNETNNFNIKNNTITLLNNKTTLLNAKKATDAKTTQEIIKIEYRAHTRGYLNKIVLENKTVSVQKSFSEEPVVKPCNDEDWSALMKLISNFNLKTLNTLEAPSKAFQYDGAAITNLTVYKGGETYQTPPFDNGKPNEEIAPIVEMILKIGKAIKEKN